MASNTGSDVGRRARDHAQDLAGRGLLLERLASGRGCAPRSSLNSRTFSMAITAWSAKVFTSAICAGGERLRLASRRTPIAPIATPVAQNRDPRGTCDMARHAAAPRSVRRVIVGVGPRHPRRGTGQPSMKRAADDDSPRTAAVEGTGCRSGPRSLPDDMLLTATRWSSSPSNRATRAEPALAQASRRSPSTGVEHGLDVGRRARKMTRRISLVAVCCSSVSVRSRLRAFSSLNRRTFSIADHRLVG